MTTVSSDDGTLLHFEVAGNPAGEPLLLIQGLGADSRGWLLQRRALGRRYRLILFDNRGAGGSGTPAGPYDLEVMAGDAVAVLDAAGVSSAHVLGVSMGGVLAQILAVRHPERVRSLVLACTACRHHQWRRDLLESWATAARAQGMRGVATKGLRWLVGPRWHRRLALTANLATTVLLASSAAGFVSQVEAILAMPDDVRGELGSITVPTLVLVGSQDILTPMGDSEELAELIPGAELGVVWGGAHGFMLDHASAFNAAVVTFLDRVTAAATAA